MIVVGWVVILWWLMEEVFNKCFYLGLDLFLSVQFKEIEFSICGNLYILYSQEEYDVLMIKVVNWCMVILDGLQRKFNLNSIVDNWVMFMMKVMINLIVCLY